MHKMQQDEEESPHNTDDENDRHISVVPIKSFSLRA